MSKKVILICLIVSLLLSFSVFVDNSNVHRYENDENVIIVENRD